MKKRDERLKLKRYRKRMEIVEAIQWDGTEESLNLIKRKIPGLSVKEDSLLLPNGNETKTANLI